MNSIFFLGGQFAPDGGGQFESDCIGLLNHLRDGQFDRCLHFWCRYLPSLIDAYKKFSYAKTASHHQSLPFGSLPSQLLQFSSSSFATIGVQSSFVQVASFLSSSFWGSCLSFGFHWLVRFRLSIWSPSVVSTSFLGGVAQKKVATF
jgi:hypothetical protein